MNTHNLKPNPEQRRAVKRLYRRIASAPVRFDRIQALARAKAFQGRLSWWLAWCDAQREHAAREMFDARRGQPYYSFSSIFLKRNHSGKSLALRFDPTFKAFKAGLR